MTPSTPVSSTPASDFLPATVVVLILIGVAMIVVVGAIIYGSRLARLRHAAQEIEEARAEKVLAKAPPSEGAMDEAPAPAPGVASEKAAATPALEQDAKSPPPPADAPEAAMPLTTIKGLGPKVAAMLAELEVTRVDQIAALSPAEADALDAKLGSFAGRMARDRWIDQAKLLTSGDRAGYEAEFGKLG